MRFANTHQLLCSLICVALFVVAAHAAMGLKLKSSLKELLPENSPSVVQLDRMLDRVGGTSVLTIAIEGPDPKANMKFVDDLEQELLKLPKEEVRYVIAKVDKIRKFYDDNMLHYVDPPDLNKLYARVKRVVDYEKIKQTPFFIDLEEKDPPIRVNVGDIKRRNKKNVKMPLAVYKDYYGGEEGRFLIVMVRPQGSSIAIDKARSLIARVQGVVNGLNPVSYAPEMKVGYCGNVVSTVEEYDTLKRDMFSTMALCVSLVCGIIVLYFLRLRIVVFLGVTLMIGITLTFAVTRYTIGYLNAQTAFLASIIIGTGINYGIILIGRYLEERKRGTEPGHAMEHALGTAALPTFLAAATTAVSFSVLMIARVRGLSQFGFIGSVGVMLCWMSTMLFLPLMVVISERVLTMVKRLSVPNRESALLPTMDRFLRHFPIVIVIVSFLTAILAGALVYRFIPHSIEYDFSKLRNRSTAVDGTEALERRVSKLWIGSMTPAVVLFDKPDEGPEVCNAVMAQNEARLPDDRMVDSCVIVQDLLPTDQDKKKAILLRFRRLLHEKWAGDTKGYLGNQIRRFKRSLTKLTLSTEDLPEDLVRNFTDLEGNVGTFAYINPRSGMPLSDGRNLIRFADTIQNIDLPDGRVMHATGASLIFSDIVKIVKKDAPLLVLASFFAVSVFVIFMVRRMKEGYVIIISLVWVILVMVAAMALGNIRINFFNFIALPLTFGVGVDYAINIAMRFHERDRRNTVHILRHTGGAVLLCAMTTIIGYSVLRTSASQAIAQFGTVAVIGEFASIFAAMLMVPALILVAARLRKKNGIHHEEDES